MSNSINSKLDAIQEEFNKPIPKPKESEMTEAVKKEKKPRKAKNKKSETVSKKAKAPKATKSEDLISLNDLADEADISATKARQILRKEGIEKDEGAKRWEWSPKSKSLKKVRKALGL